MKRKIIINAWTVVAILLAFGWLLQIVWQAEAHLPQAPRYTVLHCDSGALGNYHTDDLPYMVERPFCVGCEQDFDPFRSSLVDYVLDDVTGEIITIYDNEGHYLAATWLTFEYGPDGNPHPNSAHWISGYDPLRRADE